jgi:phage-related protein
VPVEKAIVWMGTSLDDLRAFPTDARHDAGFQLEQVQLGLDPDDWKPMHSVGAGCREIRIRTGDGAFRAFYVTKFGDQAYVLHCFTKKSRKTTQKDVDLGVRRYMSKRRSATRYRQGKDRDHERVG